MNINIDSNYRFPSLNQNLSIDSNSTSRRKVSTTYTIIYNQLTPDKHSNQEGLIQLIDKDKIRQHTNNNQTQVHIQPTPLNYTNNIANFQAQLRQGNIRQISSKTIVKWYQATIVTKEIWMTPE